MEKEQILQAKTNTPRERKAFSRLAGEVLQPEKKNMCQGEHTFGKPRCSFCGRIEDNIDDIKLKVCPKRPQQKPIYLSWEFAMKWRDWAVKEYGIVVFECAIKRMQVVDNRSHFGWIVLAQPEHYIKAACLCKLAERKAVSS